MKAAIYFQLLCLLVISADLHAQNITQTVKGMVIDQHSQELLIGATVQILGISKIKGATTDINGEFTIKNVSVGRIRLKCEYLGYRPTMTESFILNSAKEAYVEIYLEEASVKLSEVTILAKSNDKKTLNEMVALSGRSFSVEETERYAGSIADPSRMAVSFAGVQTSNDLDNDIVIRGNSSVGVLWRLEGIDIPNPNHFARIGSSGGGISIFSVNMINNSDFIFGSIPPEYGNAMSGVFDMRFRKGNKDQNEYSFRAGLLGLDLMAEGPIKKGQSSFLINYRYSTLGILNKMGFRLVNENTDNTFTDLAFHLHFPSKDHKNILQFWGIGGYSSEIHSIEEDINQWEEFDHLTHTDFKTKMGVLGINFTRLIDNSSFIKFKLAVMGDDILHAKDTMDLNLNPGFLREEKYTTGRINGAVDYMKKMNSSFQLKMGVNLQLLGNNLNFEEYDRHLTEAIKYIDHKTSLASEQLFQSYIQASWQTSKYLTLQGGLHGLYWSLGDKYSLEPRVSMLYQLSSNSHISLAYGLQSQLVPIGSYYSNDLNDQLSLMKSQQWVAAFATTISNRFTFSIEAYYQQLFDIPVANIESIQYWMLNDLVGFSKYGLTSDGKGRNYGVDISFEKFFDRGYFFLTGVSLYKSEYSLDGKNYFNSRYAGNYNTSFMFGNEIETSKGNSIQLGFRNLLYGGQRYQAADEIITRQLREYYPDRQNHFSLQNKMYWRSDLRFAYRKNLQSSSWTLSLDVQNIFNRKNTRGEIWNFAIQEFEPKYQAGTIPVISFQIDF